MSIQITVNKFYIEDIDETVYPETVFHFTGEVYIVDNLINNKYYGIYDINTKQSIAVAPKKGELYKNDVLIYNGKFTRDGQYTGQCVLYYDNGNIRYEGSMLNHKYSGFGIEYNEKGELLYEGDWVDGLQYGQGKLYENNVMIYSGYWYEGVKMGKGQDYSAKSRIYDGEWKDNMWHGCGTHYCESGLIITTTWNRGQKHGVGTVKLQNGDILINCEWKNDILMYSGEKIVSFSK